LDNRKENILFHNCYYSVIINVYRNVVMSWLLIWSNLKQEVFFMHCIWKKTKRVTCFSQLVLVMNN